MCVLLCFFFQAEDGIRDLTVTGVQTCALPILELEAVSVTTSLGIEREQRTLPYAAQTISADRLTQVPSTNVLSELQGNVAVLQVTNSRDRKSTRLNSSHSQISYAVFCLKKKTNTES